MVMKASHQLPAWMRGSKFPSSSATAIRMMNLGLSAALFSYGTTAPVDATAGYAPGGVFIDTDATGHARVLVNKGSATSSTFKTLNQLADAEYQQFGDKAGDGDATLGWDGTNLVMLPDVDNTGQFQIGNGTLDMDVLWYGGAAAATVLFDNSAAQVTFDGVDLWLKDSDILQFGDKAGDGDVTLKWDGTNLLMLPDVDDTGQFIIGASAGGQAMNLLLYGTTSGVEWLFDSSADKVIQKCALDVGVDDTGYDVNFYGATAGARMTWDESADMLALTTGTLFRYGTFTALNSGSFHGYLSMETEEGTTRKIGIVF